MKRGLLVVALLAAVAVGTFFIMRLRGTAAVTAAANAEAQGKHKAAMREYAVALSRAVPSLTVPDVNHSKVFTPAAWKKEMAEYAAWLTASHAVEAADRERQRALLDAVNRNAARTHADNFSSGESRKKLSAEQYTALWNSAFFAAGIKADSSHLPMAASCYRKNVSFLRISALTSFVYEVALIDTARGRRTVFSVYPESSTFVLAPPGGHVLLCKSSYTPGPGMIWRSAPAVISIAVPASPSLVSFTLETHVVRKKEGHR